MTDDTDTADAPAEAFFAPAPLGIGAHHNVSADVYHRDPTIEVSVSSGVLHTLVSQSPRHAWCAHSKLNPNWKPTDKTSFDIGRAAHALVLGDGKAEFELFDLPGWQNAKKDDKEARAQAWRDKKIPLLVSQYDRMVAMAKACHAQLEHLRDGAGKLIGNPLTKGRPETALIWRDAQTGVLCRARLDWHPDDVHAGLPLYDFKSTTGSAHPQQVERHLKGIGAYFQAAFYRRGFSQVHHVMPPPFRFIVQETDEPYALSVPEVGPMNLGEADEDVTKALLMWRRCLSENVWPGYPARVYELEPAEWEIRQRDERRQMDAIDKDRGVDTFAQLIAWQAPQ